MNANNFNPLAQKSLRKELINNPIYKVLKEQKNPLILLPLYDNFDLYQSFKNSTTNLKESLESEFCFFYETFGDKCNAKLERVADHIVLLEKMIDNLNAIMDSDEDSASLILTWELL